MSDKGAHFFRCDLQVHTPRDINWNGLDAATNEERRTYARELVQACGDLAVSGHGTEMYVSRTVATHHAGYPSVPRRAIALTCQGG